MGHPLQHLAILVAAGLVLGCGSEDVTGTGGSTVIGSGGGGGVDGAGCEPGELEMPDEGCRPAGLPPGTTAPGPATDPTPGVPADACGDGFASDGLGGCVAILPDGPCPPPMMAVPGDSACRPIADCGTGLWGAIPVDATTVYVDASFAGVPDGTASSPFPTIQQGIDAAPSGAIVAVAAGTYAEDLRIEDQPVALWGRCPEMVLVQGQTEPQAIGLFDAPGAEVHGLDVTGPAVGVVAIGSPGSRLEQLHVHDTGGPAIGISGGGAEVVVEGSLLRTALGVNLAMIAGQAAVLGCEIREPVTSANGSSRGLEIFDDAGTPSVLRLEGSFVHDTNQTGMVVVSSEATVRWSLLASNRTDEALGVLSIRDDSGPASVVDVAQTVIADGQGMNVLVAGSQATFDAVTIEQGVANAFNTGEGLWVTSSVAVGRTRPGDVSLTRTVMRDLVGVGLELDGSMVQADELLVQRVTPHPGSNGGLGIQAHWYADSVGPSQLTLSRSWVALTAMTGIAIQSSVAEISDSVIATVDGVLGAAAVGVGSFFDEHGDAPSEVRLVRSRVERVAGVGVMTQDSQLELEGVISAHHTLVPEFPDAAAAVFARLSVGPAPELVVRDSLATDNEGYGLLASGAIVDVEAMRVQNGIVVDGALGRGFELQHSEGRVAWSEAEAVSSAGLVASSSHLTIEGLLVENIVTDFEGREGIGMAVVAEGEPSEVEAAGCKTSQTRVVGVLVDGSRLALDHTAILEARPGEDGAFGRGIIAQFGATLDAKHSRIAGAHEAGAHFIFSGGRIEDLEVTGVLPRMTDGLFGDGIIVVGSQAPIEVARSRIAEVSRAAVSVFGGELGLQDNDLTCNDLPLVVEAFDGLEPTVTDRGGNACGCEEPKACKAVSAGLAPPEALPP